MSDTRQVYSMSGRGIHSGWISITAYVLFLGRWTIDGFIDFFET